MTSLLLMSMVSCSTVGDPFLSKARDNVFHTRRTYLTGAATGALIGGAVGAGTGALIGQNSNRAGAGALVGGIAGVLIGTAGGLMYAQHVVNQRMAYANASAYLDACAGIAAEQHASVRRYNAELRARRDSIIHDRAVLRTEIAGANRVRSYLQAEIEKQRQAAVQARAEHVPPSRLAEHEVTLEALRADHRNLTAEIERLTTYEDTNRVGKVNGN